MLNRMLHLFCSRVARPLLLGALAFALLGAAAVTKQPSAEASLAQDELDALLAPIALYPDGLLSQVLMASTYPLEVVAAERFVTQNLELHGEALDEALEKKHWDPSVQSLAAYPKVLVMMSEKLEWTARLGNAFLEDQGRVMDTVQALRKRADAAGNLKSTDQQTVVREKETIIIQPADREVVYVYDYNPAWVYGAYWYAAAASYYDRYYGGYSYSVNVSYSSYRVSGNHWGWARANWSDRNLSVDGRGNRFLNDAGRSHGQGAWQHNPGHRMGVDYPTSALRDQMRGPANGALRPGEGKPGPAAAGPGSGMGPGGAGHPPSGVGGSPGAAAGGPPNLGAGGPSGLGNSGFGGRGGPLGFGAGAPPGLGGGGPPGFGGGGPPMGGPPPPPPGPFR